MPFSIVRRVALKGEEQIHTTDIAGDQLRIGRGTSCELHLDDLSVLYAHAAIEKVEGSQDYVLKDLTGLGTTYVNREPIQERVVGDGDVIGIGPYTLRLSRASPDTPLVILVEQEAGGKADGKAGTTALLAAYRLSSGPWTKTRISMVLSLLVLGGVGMSVAVGTQRLFIPGEVSVKHRLFANDCARCHRPWKAVWAVVADAPCKTCHAGPTHFGGRSITPTPQCASCHVEHQGRAALSATPDSVCIQCHGDLKTREARSQVARQIHSFMSDHPEFAVAVSVPAKETAQRVRLDAPAGLADPAALLLNHKRHLEPDLRGPDGPEPLVCASCHHPDPQGAYMLPISYERDCQRCHLLDFDARLPGKVVPHGKPPREVHDYLGAAYAEFYVMTHKEELRARASVKRLPEGPRTEEEVWVDDMRARAERYLSSKKTKKCLLCHLVEPPASELDRRAPKKERSEITLPVLVKPSIPKRWLPYSVFSHAPHTALIKDKGCVACHRAAPTSEATADVLLPRIGTCRSCHFDSGGARTQCVACHVFHDKTVPRESAHPYALEGVAPMGAPPHAPGAQGPRAQ